uniref:Uncharacterized protein n=1 Tax=Trichogramma kaykai TaxID=54128 RepID=A0ABD2W3C7_9HYME
MCRETLANRVSTLKDGLHRLFCLVPYEVISEEIWEYVMPHWIQVITNDVPLNELHEFRSILSKMLDPDMNPSGFGTEKMYKFILKRFSMTDMTIHKQALGWLQTLSMIDIIIPLPQIFDMFEVAVQTSQREAQDEKNSTREKCNNTLEHHYCASSLQDDAKYQCEMIRH